MAGVYALEGACPEVTAKSSAGVAFPLIRHDSPIVSLGSEQPGRIQSADEQPDDSRPTPRAPGGDDDLGISNPHHALFLPIVLLATTSPPSIH